MKLIIILASFLIVLVFLALLASVLERYWRAYQAERATAQANDGASQQVRDVSVIDQLFATAVNWKNQLQGLVQSTTTDKGLSKQFRAWVTRYLSNEPALQRWLLELPEAGFDMLTQHIAAFCEEMNFDLAWLVTEQLTVAPELESTMKTMITHYCVACQQAIPAQQQIPLFTAYHQLMQPATDRQEQQVIQQLYANLITQKLAAAPAAAELVSATEAQRLQQARQAIQKSAAKDWQKFSTILQATLTAANPQSTNAPTSHHETPSLNGNGALHQQTAQMEQAK